MREHVRVPALAQTHAFARLSRFSVAVRGRQQVSFQGSVRPACALV